MLAPARQRPRLALSSREAGPAITTGTDDDGCETQSTAARAAPILKTCLADTVADHDRLPGSWQIPIETAAPACQTSRDFVPGRFSNVGPSKPHPRP